MTIVRSSQIEMRAPETLRPNPRNARTHSKRQIRKLANSIEMAGFIGAVVTDENSMILAGHATTEAAKLLDMKLVPTIQVKGLSDEQKRVFVLAANKIAENAGWDPHMLVLELGELAELLPPLKWDVAVTGFEAAEIDALFADHGSENPEPEDELPSVEASAVTRPGDLWVCGVHRILCGDARSSSDLDRLMSGNRAHAVFADVPYNQKIAEVQGRGRIKHPEFDYASGEMSQPQYIVFLKDSLGNAVRVSRDGAIHYVCNDWRHIGDLIAAGGSVYGAFLNLCVWAKTNAGQGSLYRSQHELIGVFRVGDRPHQNNVELGRFGRNRSNLWTYAGANSFGADRIAMLAMHPTVKPVALVADAMRDCSTKGDIVLDPFLGSGTTIIAAEKIGRRGYGLECKPLYVDVSVRRWEAYTKSEAVLEGDGRTFAEVKEERLNPQNGNAPQCEGPGTDSEDQPLPASAAAGDWASLCDEVRVTPGAGADK